MIFRGLGDEDLVSLATLDASLFHQPWALSALQCHLRQGGYAQGAFENQQLCGYLLGRCVAGEGEVLQFGVATGLQRRGIGRCLLDIFVKAVDEQGAEAIFLEVRESALPAQALYHRVGFEVVGRRKGYYQSASGFEDALLMRLAL